jgi:hypothetical protein
MAVIEPVITVACLVIGTVLSLLPSQRHSQDSVSSPVPEPAGSRPKRTAPSQPPLGKVGPDLSVRCPRCTWPLGIGKVPTDRPFSCPRCGTPVLGSRR